MFFTPYVFDESYNILFADIKNNIEDVDDLKFQLYKVNCMDGILELSDIIGDFDSINGLFGSGIAFGVVKYEVESRKSGCRYNIDESY